MKLDNISYVLGFANIVFNIKVTQDYYPGGAGNDSDRNGPHENGTQPPQ